MASLQSYEAAQKHPCGHVSAGVAAVLVVVSKVKQNHASQCCTCFRPTQANIRNMVWTLYVSHGLVYVWCGRRKHWLLQCQDILDEPANTYNII
jgi:hypothetical protein